MKEYDAQVKAGTLPGEQWQIYVQILTKKIQAWEAAAASALDAINELEASGSGSDASEDAVKDLDQAEVDAEDVTKEPEPTVDELAELKARATEACKNARAWAAHQQRTAAQADAACDAAYKAIMEGGDELAAAQAARKAADAIVVAGPTFDLSGLIARFGKLGELQADVEVGHGIAGAIGEFFEGLGLTPGALEGLKESPLNRELAAKWATGISTAAQTGLGLLYSIGVITEVASLGQIDTLVDAIDNVITNLGIDEIIKPLFSAPYYAALTIPTRQYWMSVFKPTVPPIQDLRVMAVREAFPVETRAEQFAEMQRWGAYHGLEEFWGEVYLKAGYERMDVRTAIAQVYWRRWGQEELKRFLSIADIHPDDHEAILATLWRNPTRYERRHGYIMGVYDTENLEEFFRRDGLRDEDAETATMAMTAYALNAERNAVARAAGRIYREVLEELHEKIVALGVALGNAIDFVVAVEKGLEEGIEWVTQEYMTEASEAVGLAKAELAAWKAKAEPIRTGAEAELRAELETLQLTGERQDLWVRRYAMEARVKTRPWEILEEYEAGAPQELEG